MKKQTKFFISVIMAITVILSVIPSALAASLGIWGPDTASRGQTISLTVSMDGLSQVAPDGMFAFGPLDIKYDNTKYDYVGETWSKFVTTNNSMLTVSPKANQPDVLSINASSLQAGLCLVKPNANSLVVLKFKVKDNAPLGESVFQIVNWSGYSDASGQEGTALPLGGSVAKVTIGDKLPSDASLKSMSVTGYEMTPAFTANKRTGYSVTVPNDVTQVVVNAEATDPKAEIIIFGNTNLKEGDNVASITVVAQDGTKSYFTINIMRTPAETLPESSEPSVESSKPPEESSESVSSETITYTQDEYELILSQKNELEERHNSLKEKFSVMAIIFAAITLILLVYIIYFMISSKKRNRQEPESINDNDIKEEE